MARVRKLPPAVLALEDERREAIRAAILALGETGTVKRLRDKVGGKQETVATILRLVRSGELDPSEPWGAVPPAPAPRSSPAVEAALAPSAPALDAAAPGPAPPSVSPRVAPIGALALGVTEEARADAMALYDEILAAKSHEQKEAASLKIAALSVHPDPTRRLSAREADILRKCLAESRQSLNARLKLGPGEDALEELVAGEEAAELVRVFESIVNGRRRRAILDGARRELEADRVDFPAEVQLDPDRARARLAELSLDAFGNELDLAPATITVVEDDRTAGM